MVEIQVNHFPGLAFLQVATASCLFLIMTQERMHAPYGPCLSWLPRHTQTVASIMTCAYLF